MFEIGQIERIEIVSLTATGPYSTNQSGWLVLQPRTQGQWTRANQQTQTIDSLKKELIQELLDCLATVDPYPVAKRFGQPEGFIQNYFDSGIRSSYSKELMVAFYFLDQPPVYIKSSSQMAHALPWFLIGYGPLLNYNPDFSKALAKLMPDDWLVGKNWLESEELFERYAKLIKAITADEAARCTASSQTEESATPTEGSATAAGAVLSRFFSRKRVQERVEFVDGKLDYTGFQIRAMSPDDLQRFVAAGGDISSSNGGDTPLMWAAFCPYDAQQFKNLVNAGADVDARGDCSRTGLMKACLGFHEHVAMQWLLAGANVHLQDNTGATALVYAGRSPVIVKALLDSGADPLAKDGDGHTALDRAVIEQNQSLDWSQPDAQPCMEAVKLLSRAIGKLDQQSLKRAYQRASEMSISAKLLGDLRLKLDVEPRVLSAVADRFTLESRESADRYTREKLILCEGITRAIKAEIKDTL